MIALLLAAAASSTAVDAERAFARDAARIGQWASFRRWSDRDAVMFSPQTVWARDFLRGRKEPRRAVRWSPAQSFTSCDGQAAVNSGPWRGPSGQGRFTTVWLKKPRGWRWIYDGGEPLATPDPVPVRAVLKVAACTGQPTGAPLMHAPKLPAVSRKAPDDFGRGESGDKTLGWDWKVEKDGSRRFRVYQWTGGDYEQVIDQRVAG